VIYGLLNFWFVFMGATGASDLTMGVEFEPMTTKQLVTWNLSLCLSLLAFGIAAVLARRKPDGRATTLFFVTLAFLALTAMSKRYIEYAVPFTLLFCGVWFTPLVESIRPRLRGGRAVAAATAGAIVLAAVAWQSHSLLVRRMTVEPNRLYSGAAGWLVGNVPPGETVFHCDWSDGALLFFDDDRHRYLLFVDPNYLYAWDPGRWHAWRQIVRGDFGTETAEAIVRELDARWGVCTWNHPDFRATIERDPRMRVVYEDRQAFVFAIDDGAAE
jgi:hypothetical protein